MTDSMDMKAFADIKEIMGDVFNDLIKTFLEFMPEQIAALELAVQQNDANQIYAIAHRIKSSSGTIGAIGLADYAEKLELQGRGGTLEDTDALFIQLNKKYDKVVDFLQQEIS